ncbi:hypothetical protein HY256_00650, partial [Candidatus Sumerlaeota bacterium]|nr:hypothetical protein [Candidatus Sumerlaeota bacterium]
FSYKPIAGITPIEHVMSLWDDLDQPPSDSAGKANSAKGAGATRSSSAWDWRADWNQYLAPDQIESKPQTVSFRPQSSATVEAVGSDQVEMVPLNTPFFVSGVPGGSMPRLKSFFAARGLDLFDAGSSAGSNTEPKEPAPPMVGGSSLAVPLMTGDLTIASIGTVTYRSGDKLLAFGHPMFSNGRSHAPMAHSYVFDYLQSYMRSFKLGEARELVGTIRQDRAFAIGGVFGPIPRFVPIEIGIGGAGASNPRSYHFMVWDDRDFMPQLAATTIDAALASSVAESGEVSAECRYTIRLTQGDKIERTIRASSRAGVGMNFFMSLMQDMFMLSANPFGQIEVAGVESKIEVKPGFRKDVLMRVNPRYTNLRPGDTLQLDTVWRPYRGEEYTKSLNLKIPQNLDDGMYVIHLADSGAAEAVEERSEPTAFRMTDAGEIVKVMKKLDYPENRLTVYLFEPDLSVGVRNDALLGLPDSIAGVVSSTAPAELQSFAIGRKLASQSEDFEAPIVGRASLMINVRRYVPR